VKPTGSVTHENAEISSSSLEAQLTTAAEVLIQPLTLGSIAAAVQAEAEKLHSEAQAAAIDSRPAPEETVPTDSTPVTSQPEKVTNSSTVTQHVAALPTSAVQIASATILNGELQYTCIYSKYCRQCSKF
jgi:hypothetical protein